MDFTTWLFGTKYEHLLHSRGFEDLFLFEDSGKQYLCFSPIPRDKNKVIDSRIYSYDVESKEVSLYTTIVSASESLKAFLGRIWEAWTGFIESSEEREQFNEAFYN